jgi:hypothetical protein
MASAAVLVSFAASAHAGYVLTINQDGDNVVAAGSGTIDLAGLTFLGASSFSGYMNPPSASIITGPASPTPAPYGVYSALLAGPTDFGAGGGSFATSGSGDVVGGLLDVMFAGGAGGPPFRAGKNEGCSGGPS